MAELRQQGDKCELSSLVFSCDMVVTELSAHSDNFGEPFGGGVTLHNSCRHDRDIFCDQLRIDAIVLGEDAAPPQKRFAGLQHPVEWTVPPAFGRLNILGIEASRGEPVRTGAAIFEQRRFR